MNCIWPIAGIAGALGIYSFYEPFRIVLTHLDLPFRNLPKGLDGFTILHLSDLHTSKYGLLEKRAESIISSLSYDMCVITGDLATTPKVLGYIRRMLGSLNHAPNIYVVPGNSEYKPWADTSDILQACEEQGFSVLANSDIRILHNSSSFVLVGLDDAYSKMHDVTKAFNGVDSNAFIIALSHCPSIVDDLINHGASLVLSGHTHGGQVRIPGIGVLWSHMRRNKKLNDGYYPPERLSKYLGFNVGESKLFVNRGLGTSRIHLRLNCMPEIALLRLCAG
jgi:predicted MPP superfamily phosphohydrolase